MRMEEWGFFGWEEGGGEGGDESAERGEMGWW
jgi:hypothetical protein